MNHSHLGAARKCGFRSFKRGRGSLFVTTPNPVLNRLYNCTDASTPRNVDAATPDIPSYPFDG